MANSNTESATSGGLLVILGIVVALALVYFFFNYAGGGNAEPDVTVNMPDTINVPGAAGQR